MARTILSRYLDPEVLSRLAGRRLDPRGLVIGNLAGAHKSPLAGFAVEFAGHREYVWGDDPKYIDWRVFYTRDRYFVKQFEMETNLVCHLVLDASASMRYGEGDQQKLHYASRMAAILAHAVVRASDKVSLTVCDDALRDSVPPSNSAAQIIRMSETLDAVRPVRPTRLPECLAEFAGRTKRREIVMVLSDLLTDLDGLERSLQRLRYQQHEVVLMQVLHHDELVFEFDSPTRFLGLEVAERIEAQPEEVRAGYLRALRRYQDRLEDVCQRNRVERVEVDTSRMLDEVLLDYLDQRARLRRMR